jgi:Ca2+-binding RTX toxin-like protein
VNVKTALTIDMAAGTATGAGVAHNFQNFEGVTGSVRGDYITGDDGDNRIRALGDYDWLIDSAGSDSYDGGNGRDMVSFIESSEGVTIYLEFGKRLNNPAEQDTFTSIERITGSSFEDIFYGSQGEDDFRGMGGYDTFYGSGGRDRYDGGSGIDTVNYFREAGVFNGFEGSAPVSEGVVASLLLGRGSAGNAARDLYTSIENLSGTMHNDVLTGDHGRNVLFGAQGDDTLIGNGGVDRLIGSSGTNILDGGSGWDYAIFDFDQSDYDWSTIAGVTTVSLTTEFTTFSYESTNTLTNIEVLSFADGDVIL